ncbi:MAG: hypothetical protein KGS61_09765 [Verrucomicrobia bacterium]|nr:hypothetical protein [Verrucomicrobiota bacterium]
MQRRVEPEWLDTLEPKDPRAAASRDDLRRINAWLGSAAVVARSARRATAAGPPRRLVELGAGDGRFMLSLATRLAQSFGRIEVILVDRLAAVGADTVRQIQVLGWRVETVRADVFDWLTAFQGGPETLMVANLFLHHFRDEDLSGLLGAVAHRTAAFVACEPRRTRAALTASSLLGLLGCNQVTRHDARRSVYAGFRGLELSQRWPEPHGWRLVERRAGWLSHCFVASALGNSTGEPGAR